MTDLETQVKRALELSEKATPNYRCNICEEASKMFKTITFCGPCSGKNGNAMEVFQAHCNPAFVKALCASWLLQREELETERMRLSAVGVAALGYFKGCDEKYHSASLDDTLKLRSEADTLRVQVEKIEISLKNLKQVFEDLENMDGKGFDLGIYRSLIKVGIDHIDKARSERNSAEKERDSLRTQVEKMRAVMGNVKPLLTRFLILLEGGFDAREACLTFEAIQEALREIDEAMK